MPDLPQQTLPTDDEYGLTEAVAWAIFDTYRRLFGWNVLTGPHHGDWYEMAKAALAVVRAHEREQSHD